jgi:hypothetical protein
VPAKKLYQSGDRVPTGGVYEVLHANHRVPHEVTLLEGQKFPPCARCSDRVRFRVVRKVKALDERRERIVLHVLPSISENDTDEPGVLPKARD